MVKIPVVNEEDEIISTKYREELTSDDINRDTGLFIVNERNEILLAQRASVKRIHPNLWTVAVAGTVEDGESYESNVVKEAEEEIGLSNIKPFFLYKYLRNSGTYKRFTSAFVVNVDSNYPFRINHKEVSQIRWFTREELDIYLESKNDFFTPGFKEYYSKFLYYENQS